MTEIPRPDLTDRPHSMTCVRLIRATPERVFDAWTRNFDTWFAEPGLLWLTPEPGAPFFFYNRLVLNRRRNDHCSNDEVYRVQRRSFVTMW